MFHFKLILFIIISLILIGLLFTIDIFYFKFIVYSSLLVNLCDELRVASPEWFDINVVFQVEVLILHI